MQHEASDAQAQPTNIESTLVSPSHKSQGSGLWAAVVIFLTMALTLIPYLIGASHAEGRRFMWLGYNLDDSCVYLSWMRQAADGATHAQNLFTTDPQHGMALNPLFLLLGRLASFTHLPLIGVYHGARLVFGGALLGIVWNFIRLTVTNRRAQKAGLLFVCFSSGLGWLPLWWSDNPIQTPIDKWQPEAITFLSLYLSPLFCFALVLQVAIITLLFLGQQRNQMRYAVGAGLCGLLLGLVHTYDVVSLTAVWLTYLALVSLKAYRAKRPLPVSAWLQAAVAGLLTAPAVLYIYQQLMSETVFRARAEVKTLSPSPIWVLAGYGLPWLLSLLATSHLSRIRQGRSDVGEHALSEQITASTEASLLLVVWTVMNFLVSYVPTSIQRKLLQGTHIPLAILAGIGTVLLITKIKPQAANWQWAFKISFVVLLSSITNVLFMLRDISNYDENRSQTQLQRTYLQPGEIESLEWVQAHSTEADAIQPLPWVARAGEHSIASSDESLACFAPGLIHRKVYCGHWGETPDFGPKLAELRTLELINTPDEARRALLTKMKVRYLIFSQKSASDDFADSALPIFRGRIPLPSYLNLVHSNADADVYEVTNLQP